MKSAVLLAAVAAVSLPLPCRAVTADFAWQGTVARGHTLTIKNVNGSITAAPASGDVVEVTARKRGTTSDPASVRILTLEQDGDVTVCAVWPSRQTDQAPCQQGRAHDGTGESRDNDVRVDFTLKVPSGVNLVLRTVNGGIAARDLSGNVDATTVNGSVGISTSAGATARTVNGQLDVAMANILAGGTALETVNGSIALTVPRSLSADFSGQTLNGSVSSDVPITLEKNGFGRMASASGRLGKGGPPLRCKTLNGTIHINVR